MKVLFIGDLIGKAGRRALKEIVPVLVLEHNLDLKIGRAHV